MFQCHSRRVNAGLRSSNRVGCSIVYSPSPARNPSAIREASRSSRMAPAAVSCQLPPHPHSPFAIVHYSTPHQSAPMASAAAITPHTLASPRVSISVFAAVRNSSGLSMSVGARRVPGISVLHSQRRRMVAAAATATEMPPAARGEKTFSEEMRAAAMRLHTKDQAKEGEKEPEARSAIGREPIVEGYLHYLVDSKLLFQTLENIVDRAVIPCYAEFRNTGLERSEALKKDLKWFSDQGHTIPKPSSPGTTYASYIEELSEKNPQAFICHFYNVYFAHSAGGQKVGKKIAENILNKKELEFYKWEGTLTQMLQNVCTKINQVASSWSQEEKNHCLEETEKSFTYLMDCLRQIDIQPERIQ